MDLFLPQEVIDQIIGYIEDRVTLVSLRLVSKSCRGPASRLYFRKLFVMLSSKSAANMAHLSKSPYSSYVEELHWADKELQYQLNVDLEVFQDTFKERLAGLSSEAVQEWHEKYRALYSDQQSLHYPGTGKQRFDVESFVNLKRVSIINGCETGAEQYPTALEAPETLHSSARWSTTRHFLPQPGDVHARIIQSLGALNRLTHLSIKTDGPKWERLFVSAHPLQNGSGPVSPLANIKHLDVELCLLEGLPEGTLSTPRCRISGLQDATNLESLTWKAHVHAVDEAGNLGMPLTELWRIPRFLSFRSELYLNLRHIELRTFYVPADQLLECLTTLKYSLQSIIFRHCLFENSLAEVFMSLRKKRVVPPVAIFEQCRQCIDLPIWAKPPVLSEWDVTKYLIRLGIKGTLYLHSWDEQIEAYLDSIEREERGAKRVKISAQAT